MNGVTPLDGGGEREKERERIIYLGNYSEAGSTPVAREPQIIECKLSLFSAARACRPDARIVKSSLQSAVIFREPDQGRHSQPANQLDLLGDDVTSPNWNKLPARPRFFPLILGFYAHRFLLRALIAGPQQKGERERERARRR